jgi:hypothetical protein
VGGRRVAAGVILSGSFSNASAYLSEQQRRDVVQYVKWLTAEVGPDSNRVSRFEAAKAKGELKAPVHVPTAPGS